MSAPGRWLFVIGSTLILWAVSERVFWSLWRPEEILFESAITFMMYGLAVYIILCAIDYFTVSTLPAMVLMGALYGWIVEGIIAMTVFGLGGIPLPFSLSWTALAWHMPFSVIALWWWYHKAVTVSFRKAVGFALAFGLAWGLWSMTWFFEADPIITTVSSYAIHAVILTLLMIFGHMLMGQNISTFKPPTFEKIIVFGIIGLFFVAVTIPTVWYSVVVIPLLWLLIYIPLGQYKKRGNHHSSKVLQELSAKAPLKNLLSLLCAPLVATMCYALMIFELIPLFPINYIVLGVTTLGGFVLFCWAWYKTFVRP